MMIIIALCNTQCVYMMKTMMLVMVMVMVMVTTPVKEHDTANEVETEEHWQTKGDIHGHPLSIRTIIVMIIVNMIIMIDYDYDHDYDDQDVIPVTRKKYFFFLLLFQKMKTKS